MMMTCEVVRTHLSSFMDGALPGGTMADVWKHMNECHSCHELYEALYRADQFYSAVATCAVPQEYRDSLRARMEE
jgi:predicted anti-sigma-YlaC factor YlaD